MDEVDTSLRTQKQMETSEANSRVFVGRQPIYTSDLKTFAYELLFRSGESNFADVADGDVATAQLLMNTFTEIGLESLVGDLPAFFNVPESFLTLGYCSVLPKARVVIEVLEDCRPTPEVLAALKQLKGEGYTIALDDFVLAPELMPLVELADIIKVELPAIPRAELPVHVDQLRQYDLRLLAEKVETLDEYEFCKGLGFDYYQGYFFCRPAVVSGRKVPSNRLAMVRLIAQLQKSSVDLEEVVEIIQSEPTIAYKLLRFVNSVSSALKRKIESIHHAATLAGILRIKTMATLAALSDLGDGKPKELIQLVLTRAKMAEFLAVEARLPNAGSYFLTGLFSGLDAILDVPLEEALETVPISEAVRNALQDRSGELGLVLNCVLHYEHGNWEEVSCGELDVETIRNAYLRAIDWSNESMAGV